MPMYIVSDSNRSELINLITVVIHLCMNRLMRAQNMTANITGKKNASMNDSGNIFSVPMPVHLPFAPEITGS